MHVEMQGLTLGILKPSTPVHVAAELKREAFAARSAELRRALDARTPTPAG